MKNWDDARIFLAIARQGTSRAAARQLGLNQSTVSRRVAQLEADAGVALFERRPSGLKLTEAGHETLALAQQVEETFALFDRKVGGRDVKLSGSIRLSLPDLGVSMVAPILAEFGARYPEIELEVIVENGYVSLTHRHADVVLRLGQRADEHLVGRRIGRAAVAVYASPEYMATVADPSDLSSMEWVRWEEPFRRIPPEVWFDTHTPSARVRAQINTSLAQLELIASGAGVAFQLCFLGDADPRLVRIAQPADFGLSIWLLTHEDLRATARIRAFMELVGDGLQALRARIEGTGGVEPRAQR